MGYLQAVANGQSIDFEEWLVLHGGKFTSRKDEQLSPRGF
jgi:hypothetical protein